MPNENEHIKRCEEFKPNLKNIRTLNTGTGKVEFKSLLEIFTPMFANRNSKPKEKKVRLTALQINYNRAVNDYLELFVKKHGYEFTDWVSGEVGGIACFIEQYFFNFDDIKFDIDNKIKKDLIFQYQDDSLAHPKKNMNFRSYAKGLRFEDIKNGESKKNNSF